MPLSLTCSCGARFEADETLAGQSVLCPECQQPLTAPSRARPPRRTSLLALASAVLALVGAFTVVGTALAVALGLAALAQIARGRERLAGAGLAAFGVVAGAVFTGLTVFAFDRTELFGLGGSIRENLLAGQIDTAGPLEVVLPDKGFALSRPSAKWGRAVDEELDDAAVQPLLLPDADVVLVQAAGYLFVDARADDNARALEECQAEVLAQMQGSRHDEAGRRPAQARVEKTERLPDGGGLERRELRVEVRSAGQRWTFLVRLHRARDGRVFVARAFTRHSRFPRAEAELRRALDSFRVLDE